MHVLAFRISCGNFFAREQEGHAFAGRKRRNLVAQCLEPGRGRWRFLCVVFFSECEIVGVVGAAYEIEPDCLCRLLQYGRGCSVFHVVAGVSRVAVHLAGDKSGCLRGLFREYVNFERLGL